MVEGRKQTETNPMAATWTKAAIVRRKFKAGRPRVKDRQLSPIRAIHETCILLDDLRTEMRSAGLEPNDAKAWLVVATQSEGDVHSAHGLLIPPPDQLGEVFKKVASIKNPVMLGIVFRQFDRDPKAKEKGVVWIYPFLTGPIAQKLLMEHKKQIAEGKKAN